MPPILLPTVVGCFGPRPPARRQLVALPGIEPGCPGGRWILSPLRLPVPPEGPLRGGRFVARIATRLSSRAGEKSNSARRRGSRTTRGTTPEMGSAGENLPERDGMGLAVWAVPPCPASVGQKHEGDQHDPHYRRCAFRFRARLVRRFRPDRLDRLDDGLERHLVDDHDNEERLDRQHEALEEV